MHIKWQPTPVSAAHYTGVNRRAGGYNPNNRRRVCQKFKQHALKGQKYIAQGNALGI